MRKISIGIICLILALTFGNSINVSGQSEVEDMSVPMGDILLEPPDSVEESRPAVNFPHSIHFDYTCQTCHHTWEKVTHIVGCSVSGCHDVTEAPKRSDSGRSNDEMAARYYKAAFHKMCITCHKEIKLQNKKLELSGRVLADNLPNSGPTSCKECHVPEE